MMSERRASMRPPEMMNGSTKGRVSSYNSTLTMRISGHVEEVEFAAPPLERPGDDAVHRVEHERMQGALRARAVRRRILGQRELEKRVQLDALAAAPGVVEEQAAGADVAGADERAVEAGRRR